ncbi:proteinase-activated receptor 2 [Arapaima gigas]
MVALLFSAHFSSAVKSDIHFKGLPISKNDSGMLTFNPAVEEILKSKLTTVFLPAVYTIVFAVGLPTNAMAIWVFVFRSKKKTPATICMASLALSDLLFVTWIPLKVAYHLKGNNWIYGEGLCRVLVGCFYGNMYSSVLFVTCISMHRCRRIVDPLLSQRENNHTMLAVSVAIFLSSWLATVPLYMYDQAVHIGQLNITTCHDVTKNADVKRSGIYFLSMGVFGFIIPSVVCIAAYVTMLRHLKSSAIDKTVAKRRRKPAVLIATVLVMFLVCFTPSNIMLLVHYGLLLSGNPNAAYGFYVATLCLASLNSCLDPFLYYFVSEDFRSNVKNTLICRSIRTVDRMKVSFNPLKYSKTSSTYNSDSTQTQSSSCQEEQ